MYQLIAQATTPVTQPFLNTGVVGLSGWGYVNRIIANLISIGFVVGIVIFLFFLIWGGISWINARGDRAALESARHKVSNAITGLILLLLLYVILTVILLLFKVDVGGLGLGSTTPPPLSTTTPPPLSTTTPPPLSTPAITYFNSATDLNCDDFCSNFGLTCVSRGTDLQGTNNRAVIWNPSIGCAINYNMVSPCIRVMADYGSNLCQDLSGNNADPNSYPADWTYCNCQ